MAFSSDILFDFVDMILPPIDITNGKQKSSISRFWNKAGIGVISDESA